MVTTDLKLPKDTFRFIVPADLEKAADGSYKVRGLASTERVDQQGETIIQKGVDLTPIDKKKGILNWDHARGPENTIGILDGYERTSKGLVIEGRLFKNHTKAKAVREIMESLGEGDRGRMGLSVEGKILERDPLNPSIIRKCQISAVALTMNPVNNDTFADIIKSMNSAEEVEFNAEEQAAIAGTEEAMFTASQVIQIVQKAMGIGAGAMGAPDAKTGGDALQPSDMKAEKCKKCGLMKCEHMGKSEVLEDGTTVSKIPMAVQKSMKKMSKALYKSNLLTVLDRLQVLYPNHSRSEIWEAVKERLETKFDMAKGGVGSGIKGHTSVRSKDYSWGRMRHLDSKDPRGKGRANTTPIHPEHWEKMQRVHLGHSDKESFKDETGLHWTVTKHPGGDGVKLHHDSIAGKFEHNVSRDDMKAHDSEDGLKHYAKKSEEVESDLDKGGAGSGVKGHETPAYKKFLEIHRNLGAQGHSHAVVKLQAKHKELSASPEHSIAANETKQKLDMHQRAYKEKLGKSEETESDVEKAIRLKNTSGKEREHKLYEDARQRDDYETNKDKSRAELNRIAEESGADKHSKEKIRAQADAAIQAGEDRDHVRPNVKG